MISESEIPVSSKLVWMSSPAPTEALENAVASPALQNVAPKNWLDGLDKCAYPFSLIYLPAHYMLQSLFPSWLRSHGELNFSLTRSKRLITLQGRRSRSWWSTKVCLLRRCFSPTSPASSGRGKQQRSRLPLAPCLDVRAESNKSTRNRVSSLTNTPTECCYYRGTTSKWQFLRLLQSHCWNRDALDKVP